MSGSIIKGIYGFRYKNKDYILQSMQDSQIEKLGEHIFNFVKYVVLSNKIEQLKQNVENINLIIGYQELTPENIEYLKQFHDEFELSSDEFLSYSRDWFTFFSQEEGNMFMFLDGFKYMCDFSMYTLYSKETKYGYIVNLDDNSFEVYFGENDRKLSNEKKYGRYARLQAPNMHDNHYGIVLAKKIPFDKIKEFSKLTDFIQDYNKNLRFDINYVKKVLRWS